MISASGWAGPPVPLTQRLGLSSRWSGVLPGTTPRWSLPPLAVAGGELGRVGVPAPLRGAGTPSEENISCARCCAPSGRLPVSAANAAPPTSSTAAPAATFTTTARVSARTRVGPVLPALSAGGCRDACKNAAMTADSPASSWRFAGPAAAANSRASSCRSERVGAPVSNASASRAPIRRGRCVRAVRIPSNKARQPRNALHSLRPERISAGDDHPGRRYPPGPPGLCLAVAGKAAQPAHRCDPDRAGPFAEHLRGLGDVEARDNAQHERLGLVLRQLGDQRQCPFGTHPVERLGRGIRCIARVHVVAGRQVLLAPPRAAQLVHPAVAGDAEQPDAEQRRISTEAADVAGRLQPRLRGRVLRIAADDHAQIPQHSRLERAPENREPALVSGAGGGQRAGEIFVVHGSTPSNSTGMTTRVGFSFTPTSHARYTHRRRAGTRPSCRGRLSMPASGLSLSMSDRWYDEAVIYCVDVETYADSDDDGCGDLRGLIGRLDYLARLGITCLWLHPIHPSPGRDDGYDVTDFYGVNPNL